LVAELRERVGLSARDASRILDSALRIVCEVLADEGQVNIPELGRFMVLPTPSRPGRNPKTGEPVEIPAKLRPIFRPSRSLRARMMARLEGGIAGKEPYPGPYGPGLKNSEESLPDPLAEADLQSPSPLGDFLGLGSPSFPRAQLAASDRAAEELAARGLAERDLAESDLSESDLAESDLSESDLPEPAELAGRSGPR
jgi:nucleoid DNA-binding protein